MSLESPPRLKHGAELGPILKAADAPVPPERLASNQAAIKAAIAAAVVRSIPLWIKIGLPLVLLVGGYAVYRAISPEEPPPAPAPVAIATTPLVDAALAIEADAMIAIDATELIVVDAAPVAVAKKKPRVEEPVVVPPVDAALPRSELPEQIQLYEDARAAAATGDVARGIDLLDELVRRFPATQLRAEAELTRAELLTRANRLDAAATALEALVVSPVHRGRRGELYRALGDVRRKQGDCTRAVAAYTRARASKLSAAETIKVERGLERCATPK